MNDSFEDYCKNRMVIERFPDGTLCMWPYGNYAKHRNVGCYEEAEIYCDLIGYTLIYNN